MSTHLFEAFRHQTQSRPGEVALIAARSGRDELAKMTWGQLAAVVTAAARALQRRLDHADSFPQRIGHASDNSLDDVVIALAAMELGAVEVPIDARLPRPDIESRWQRIEGLWLDAASRAELIGDAMGVDPVGPSLGDEPPSVDLDQPALVLWTSGTTGRPQGVTLSQRNLHGNAAAKLAAVPQREDDVRLCVLPICHAYARTCDFGTWLLSGCTLALTMGMEGWRRVAAEVQPTMANTVPGVAEKLLAGDATELGLSRLCVLGCGGAALSVESFYAWKRRGVTVIQGYGLTETSPVVCSATPGNATAGLVGTFVAGWEHEIRDGRLFVRGPHNMLGYWGDPSSTAKKIDRIGWLDTRDLVEVDRESGQLRILGRADDVIVLDSARKMNPRPRERQVEAIAGVRHAMLIFHDGQLQLYVDGEWSGAIQDDIESIFAAGPKWQQPEAVRPFEPSLSVAAGELTAKGTMRRTVIRQHRFSSRA